MDIKYSTPTRSKLAFLLITCFFIQAFAESRMPIIEAAKALFFSLPTAYDSWVHKVKALFFQQGKPYFPPSSLSGGGEEERMGNQGTTDKVKEAAVKSLDKSKTTVEDSAKAAARMAEEAVDKTVKKLKRTLSTGGSANQDHEAEL